MSYLAVVPPLHLGDVWIKALPHLLNGKDRWEHFYTAEQIRQGCLAGRIQLWLMIDEISVIGVVLTQIDDFPNGRSLRFLYLGGNGFKRNMIKEMKKIEMWAKERGCKVIDFMGREEWEPLLKMMGYKSPGIVYRKEL